VIRTRKANHYLPTRDNEPLSLMTDFDPVLAIWTGLLSVLSTFTAYKLLKRLESRKLQRTEKKLVYSKFLKLTDTIISVLNDLYSLSLLEFKKPKNEDEARAMITQLTSYPTILSNDDTMEVLRYYTYGTDDDNTSQTKRSRQTLMQAVTSFIEDMQTDLIIEMNHIASKQLSILGRHGYELIALNVSESVNKAMNSTLDLIQERRKSMAMAWLAKLAKQPLTQDSEPWNEKWKTTYQTLRTEMELDLKKTL
jgi:hypothetical protein